MPLIQITNTYKNSVLELVEKCVPNGFVIRTLPENSPAALLEMISDADYLLASGRIRIDREMLEHAKKLKMIQRTGVGLDTLDIEGIKESNIPLYVNPGINSQSVAEHTMLLILACLRRLTMLDKNCKKGVWKKQEQGIETFELRGKTVGIIGMGSVGKTVARMLQPFDAKVVYYDLFHENEIADAKYVELENLLAQADVISLHCPLTNETRSVICRDSLAKMREGVILINTARGELVNEEDLLEAIESGKVAFAGLDVFVQEPFAENNILVSNEHVIATPHIGGVTYDSFCSMMFEAMHNIALFEKGRLEEIKGKRIV